MKGILEITKEQRDTLRLHVGLREPGLPDLIAKMGNTKVERMAGAVDVAIGYWDPSQMVARKRAGRLLL